MSVVDFIKEKNEKFQKNQNEIIKKIEPQLRDFSDSVIQKIHYTKNSPWFMRLSQIYEGDLSETNAMQERVHIFYDKLSPNIGEEIGRGEWFTVDQDRIDQFAEVTEDKQWIHVDSERAKRESPFRSTVSHGFLTLALIPRLTGSVNLFNSLQSEARMVVNCGLNRVRFPYPAKSGAQIRAKTTLKKIIPQRKSLEIVNEITVEVKGSSRLVCIAETVIRIYV